MNNNLKVGDIWDKKWEKLDVLDFKAIAFKSDPWTMHHKPLIEKYINEVSRNGVFLEAGCGMGHWCFYISEKYGMKSLGVDIAKDTIEKLQKNQGGLVSFTIDDLNNSKLENNSIDMFISLGVVEHFKDSNPMVKNLNQLLKPGGVGIITVPNIYSIHTITRPILQFFNKWDIGYEKSFSPGKLKILAKSNGFNIVEYGTLPSGELFGCFLNNLPIIGEIIRKISLFIEKKQNIFGFISYIVVKKND